MASLKTTYILNKIKLSLVIPILEKMNKHRLQKRTLIEFAKNNKIDYGIIKRINSGDLSAVSLENLIYAADKLDITAEMNLSSEGKKLSSLKLTIPK